MKNIIIIFLLLLTYYSKGQNDVIVINEGKGIEGIVFIGDGQKDVVNKLGRSDAFLYTKYVKSAIPHPKNKRDAKSIVVTKVGRPKDVFFYDSLELYISFNKQKIVNEIYCKSSKYQTSKGLKIGDSREKFISLYDVKSNSPTTRINHLGLSVDFECDVVKEIHIYKPY